MSKTAGIIGGMGPLSTMELMKKIYFLTKVEKEQEHLRLLVDNRPQIPDRTAYILGQGPSPLPMLRESARLLQQAGVDFLAMACNTAHYFYHDISSSISIPFLNMLQLAGHEIVQQMGLGEIIAVLTTSGARTCRLYEPYLTGYTLIYPSPEIQETCLMEAVYGRGGIKSDTVSVQNKNKISKAIDEVVQQHPAMIIAGCTEIELALKQMSISMPVLYPMDLLAAEIIRMATS